MSHAARLAAALAIGALSLSSAPARADTLSTFTFQGACADCAGMGTGTLTLDNYTVGTAITPGNFSSFTYDGTDLLAGFTIEAGQDVLVRGSIDTPLPGPESVDLFLNGLSFMSASSGFWCVGEECVSDYGFTHVWSAAGATTEVPEPMSIALLGGGLLGLGALRSAKTK